MGRKRKKSLEYENLLFWDSLKEKLPNYLDKEVARQLTHKGMLAPYNVTPTEIKLAYDEGEFDHLINLYNEIEYEFLKVLCYINPKLQELYFIPDEAIDEEEGGLLSEEEFEHPIIHINVRLKMKGRYW